MPSDGAYRQEMRELSMIEGRGPFRNALSTAPIFVDLEPMHIVPPNSYIRIMASTGTGQHQRVLRVRRTHREGGIIAYSHKAVAENLEDSCSKSNCMTH